MYVKISVNDSEKIIDLIKSEINKFWRRAWSSSFKDRDPERDSDPILVPVNTIRYEITTAINAIGDIRQAVEDYKHEIPVSQCIRFCGAEEMVSLFKDYSKRFLELGSNKEPSRVVALNYLKPECMRISKSMFDAALSMQTILDYHNDARAITVDIRSKIAKHVINEYFEDMTDLFDEDK